MDFLGFGLDSSFYDVDVCTWLKVYGMGTQAFFFLAGVWYIWCLRNEWEFQHSQPSRDVLFRRVCHLADGCAACLREF